MRSDRPAFAEFSSAGRLRPSAAIPWGHFRDDGAAALYTQRRLDVSRWTKLDPNTREGAAPTDLGDGSGIRFSLTGGWSTTDPTAGVCYVDPEPVTDVFGVTLAGLDLFNFTVEIRERAAPSSLSSDLWFGMGLLTEPTFSATCFGALFGYFYNSSSRSLRRGIVSGGVGGVTTAGSLSTSIRGVQALFSKLGIGSGSPGSTVVPQTNIPALASDGSLFNVGITSGTAAQAPNMGTAYLHLHRVFAMCRLSAVDATTRTFDVDLYEHPGPASRMQT